MKRILTLLVLTGMLLVEGGCRKYTEDEMFTLLPPKARLSREWILVYYRMGNAVYEIDEAEEKVIVEYHSNGDIFLEEDGEMSLEGSWEISEDDSYLTEEFFNGDKFFYRIEKLTRKELKLSLKDLNARYEYSRIGEAHYVSAKAYYSGEF